QDMIKLAVGVIATSTALVLGLLVSSSKGQFDAMGSRLVQFGANVIILDNTLAEYGPEAKPVRDQLRQSVEETLRRIWPEERIGGAAQKGNERGGADDRRPGPPRPPQPAAHRAPAAPAPAAPH